jgi:hypothetical protein
MFSSGVLQQAWRLTHRQFPTFLAQITLHSFLDQHLWNLLINHHILTFIRFDALILRKSLQSKWVKIDCQQPYIPQFFRGWP